MEPAGDAGCLSVDCDQLVVSGFCKARAWGIEGARDFWHLYRPRSLTATSRAVKREPVQRDDFRRCLLDCESAEHLSPLASLAGLG